MELAVLDAVGYGKLLEKDRTPEKIFAFVVSEYYGIRKSPTGCELENVITTITQNVPSSRRLEWIGFLLYAMRSDVVSDAEVRGMIKELFEDASRVAKRKDDTKQKQCELVTAQAKAAARSPLGVVALAGGGAALCAGIAKGAAIGGVSGGPIGALVGGGLGGIVGALVFLR
ncbi:MAG: hypothetical protein LBS68_01415 [Puniceicoccales bacterium]|jgi:hypothetical protein|nr:hypothetical protein [Puniceicoccales bacterium]